jgi:ferrous iron transport protein B
MLLWEKARDFLQRAFTVIFCATIVIWFLQSFSFGMRIVSDPSDSILGIIASVISPVFAPIGLDDWRITTSLVSGFMAKESVVSTLTVLFGEATPIASMLSVPSVLSLLVFCLLYTPCVAAIAAIRRELGNRDALFVIVFQCVVAYIVSFIVYNLAFL